MRWFGSDKARDVRAPAQSIAAVFADRALMAAELLSISPNLSDIQVAVLWGVCAVAMRKTVASDESAALLNDVACDFFDTFCQDYVRVFCRSDLKLDLSSISIIEMVEHTLEAMPPEYLDRVTELFIGLSANAADLAGATISIISMSMSSKEKTDASRHAAAFIDMQGLSSFEKTKAHEWLLSFWSSK